MRKLLITIMVVMTSLSIFAQDQDRMNPGYMGRTKYISYEPSYYLTGYSRNFHVIHFHKLAFNNVYERNKMWTASFEICKMNFIDEDGSKWRGNYRTYPVSIFDKNIAVEHAWFKKRRGAIAPMGTHRGVGLGIHFKNSEVDQEKVVTVVPYTYVFWNRQYVIKNRMVFNYGLDIGFLWYGYRDAYPQRYVFKPSFGIGYLI